MYKNLNVKIKWNNGISENVEVKQGIGQGEKFSTVLKLKSLCLFVSGTSSDLLTLILTKSLLVMLLTMSSMA
jgi:hypothetical protein